MSISVTVDLYIAMEYLFNRHMSLPFLLYVRHHNLMILSFTHFIYAGYNYGQSEHVCVSMEIDFMESFRPSPSTPVYAHCSWTFAVSAHNFLIVESIFC